MLWIRIGFVQIRIRILPFKPGQLNNWQILSVHIAILGQLKDLSTILKFSKEIPVYLVNEKLERFEEKCLRICTVQIFLSKRSDPDPVHLF
jgi:hypothetical protein